MTAVVKGVRILEVAEQVFVPGASALLADYGAEVIKIEPVERGDAARGLSGSGPKEISPTFQNVNRGKESLGLDLATPEGRDILYRLAATADIFLTNKLPHVRKKLGIDVDDIRACNPDVIYVRGTGQGEHGPDAERGGYDLLSFWYRTGAAVGAAGPQGDIPFLPAPGFGDLLGAMTVAGGMMGALYHRAVTGEALVVDISLLAAGMWAMSGSIATAAVDEQWRWPPGVRNPLSATYRTADGRWIALCCLQAGYYWPLICDTIGRPELAGDPRFADHAELLENSEAAQAVLAEVFAARTVEECRALLADFRGQWTVVQDWRQVQADEQAGPNGYLQACVTSGGVPFTLVAAPVQFGSEAAVPRRGPDFNEHGDAILAGLGLDWDAVVDLKVRGIVA